MNDSVQRLVELIHASPTEATIVVAGAGGQAVAWLLAVPGASRTILEALVPYGKRSMLEFLGHEPARYVSPETARKMAEVAYRRALHLLEDPVPSPPSSAKSVGDEVTTAEEIPGGLGERVVGLACTASIATDRPKRGEHRCCVATWNHAGVTIYDLKYAKGQRDRPGEEDVASRLVLRALAKSCGIDFELPLGLLETESLDVRYTKHADPLRRLLASPGDTEWGRGLGIVTVYPDGGMAVDEPLGNAAVLPGSFSPLHWGHELLAKVASEMLAIQAVFELSVVNVDKPLLAEREVRRRLSSFRGRWQVVLTRAPTFHEKAVPISGLYVCHRVGYGSKAGGAPILWRTKCGTWT